MAEIRSCRDCMYSTEDDGRNAICDWLKSADAMPVWAYYRLKIMGVRRLVDVADAIECPAFKRRKS